MASSYGKAFLKGMKSMMMFGASKSSATNNTTAASKDKSSPTVEEQQRYQQNSEASDLDNRKDISNSSLDSKHENPNHCSESEVSS